MSTLGVIEREGPQTCEMCGAFATFRAFIISSLRRSKSWQRNRRKSWAETATAAAI